MVDANMTATKLRAQHEALKAEVEDLKARLLKQDKLYKSAIDLANERAAILRAENRDLREWVSALP